MLVGVVFIHSPERVKEVGAEMVLRRLRNVDVYGGSASTWLFAERCSGVYEQYSAALQADPNPLLAAHGWVRIFPSLFPGRQDEADEFPPSQKVTTFETMYSPVPAGSLELPRSHWHAFYLDWVHQRLMFLARLRGWDTGALERAYEVCRGVDGWFRLSSKPRMSPDRQHKAHVTLEIDADGVRYLTLAIRARNGERSGSTTRQYQPFVPDAGDFRAMARHIRWNDPTTVLTDLGSGVDRDGIPFHLITAEVNKQQYLLDPRVALSVRERAPATPLNPARSYLGPT